jgi:anti-sigma regulatory factor (Ser/Thr protein kinase)
MGAQTCIRVSESSQVGEVRRAAVRAATALHADETTSGEVAIVATELATNLVKHAKAGRILLQPVTHAEETAIEIVALDGGPGMVDAHKCFADGYSSRGTPGTGLGAVRRLSHVCDVYSSPTTGTVLVSRIRTAKKGAGRAPVFAVGCVSIPAPHESVCGDAWSVAERNGDIAVMVADGLGHGPLAADASQRAIDTFDRMPFADAGALFDRVHQAVTGSRGAAVASAQVVGRTLRYTGIGNISGTLLAGDERRGLLTQNGTVGLQPRRAQPVEYPWPDRGVLIMHSDGLTSRWALDAYPGLLARHPAVVAAVLYRDFVRGRDDATVVVVGRERVARTS